ncbi:MAG: transport system permease protein, partial [Caulobacteraceae bacterium]|nr:transport system permease protein [Caulobacteraceae bacterium]
MKRIGAEILLLAALALMLALSIGLGEVQLSWSQLVQGLTDPASPAGEILWAIRAPRACAAALVGAALGLSGAVMQGLLRNPLADPGVLGVSAVG